jgi:ATP-dependent DNA helicase RecG
LQEQIREANKEFIEQAMERARAAEEEKKPGPIVLSPLENSLPDVVTNDLSTDALARYRTVAGIEEAVGTPAFFRQLALQGLLKQEEGKWVPTGFGLLLFGQRPRVVMPQVGLLGTIHLPDGREDLRDFAGPQLLAPEQALQWLRDKLPNPVDRSQAQRREINEVLYELAREGIVNGLVHRDYGIEGAKCQLVASADTITIMSPGKPPDPITLEQMQSFDAPMLSRNPILHYVFSQMDLAEERGLGLKSMKQRAEQAGLPLPAYSWRDPYLVLTIHATGASVIPGDLLDSLSKPERAGWEWLATKESVSSREYAEALGVPNRTALNHLKRFTDLNLLEKTGSSSATRYRIRR